MEFVNFIAENSLMFIPVIYIIGTMLKGTSKVPDKYIPILLLPIGITLSMLSIGVSVDAFVQGVLVVGAAVYANQVVKQMSK